MPQTHSEQPTCTLTLKELEWLLEGFEHIRLARRRMFGPCSEAHIDQGLPFNEAEQLVDAQPDAPDTVTLPTAAEQAESPSAPAARKPRGKHVPMQIRVLRTIRKRYACPDGQGKPAVAPGPGRILPRSNASNSLLATLLTVK